jgi:hypothetical protein
VLFPMFLRAAASVQLAHIDVRGAQGGGNEVFGIPVIPGGEGGRTAEVRVFPGEVIHIFLGAKGGDGGTLPPPQSTRRTIQWGLQRRG